MEFSFSEKVVATLAVSADKFTNGKYGMEFQFISRKANSGPHVNLDSVIIHSECNKILLLNTDIHGITTTMADGGFLFDLNFRLDAEVIRFFHSEAIGDVTLFINKIPNTLYISKRYQRMLKQWADDNYP